MKLTNNLHVSVAGDGGEGRGLGADLTPVPAGALLRQLRQLDLPRVRVVVVDDDAGAHVVGDRVLATWQVSRRKDKTWFEAWHRSYFILSTNNKSAQSKSQEL